MIATDVLQVGQGDLESLISERRPAHPGYNIGHRMTGSGTLGFVAFETETGTRVGASCAHVIGRNGFAASGDHVLIPDRANALQNGVLASATAGVLRRVVPISFVFEDANVNVDAASFEFRTQTTVEGSIALLDMAPQEVAPSIRIGMSVRKVGYATRLTRGTVEATDMLASFKYRTPSGERTAWFGGQIGISSFTREGDSGSLVIDEAGRAVGVHIGRFGGFSVATPISRVLRALGCSFRP